jgi:quinol-cytochrome oxidoreductase complex cytochrome b subunit
MHYIPETDQSFDSVEDIMRNVNYGWFARDAHLNGASFFFFFVYCHMFRNIYYYAYTFPK